MTVPSRPFAATGALPTPRARPDRPVTPLAIQAARWLLLLIALSHAAVPVLMAIDRARIRADIADAQPKLDLAQIDAAVSTAFWAALVFHALLFALICMLWVRLPSRSRPFSWLTSVAMLATIGLGMVSWRSSTMFHWLIPWVDLAALAVIALLWAPRPSRAFFTAPSR